MTHTPWCLLFVSIVCLMGCWSPPRLQAAQPIRTPGDPPMDASLVTGANIDESKVTSTLLVGSGHPYSTLRAAIEVAIEQL